MNGQQRSLSVASGRPLSNLELLDRAHALLAKGDKKSNLISFEPYNIKEVKKMIDKTKPREAVQ